MVVTRDGAKGHLPLMSLTDMDEIICTGQVKLDKDLGLAKLFQCYRNDK